MDDEQSKIIRQRRVEDMLNKQFQLVYFGKFDMESLEKLSIYEINFMYNTLVKTIKEQNKARAEAAKSVSKIGMNPKARIKF